MFNDLVEEIRYEMNEALDEGFGARLGHFGREALAKVGYRTQAKKSADRSFQRHQDAQSALKASDPEGRDHLHAVGAANRASKAAAAKLSGLGDTKRASMAQQTATKTGSTLAKGDAEADKKAARDAAHTEKMDRRNAGFAYQNRADADRKKAVAANRQMDRDVKASVTAQGQRKSNELWRAHSKSPSQ